MHGWGGGLSHFQFSGQILNLRLKKKTTYPKKMFFDQVLNEREKYKKLQSWKKNVSLIYETHASCIELRKWNPRSCEHNICNCV